MRRHTSLEILRMIAFQILLMNTISIKGLTSSWSYPIYCSEITGKLLVQRYGIKEDLIHTMQVF
jgi:hypothetical protein